MRKGLFTTTNMFNIKKAMAAVALSVTVVGSGLSTVSAAIFDDFTVSGSGAEDMVSVASAQQGKTEAEMGYNGTWLSGAWCAAFVSDAAEEAGQSEAIPWSAYPPTLYEYIKTAGGVDVYAENVQPGDIVFLKCEVCGRDKHVGIMVSEDHMIDGNNWYNNYSHVAYSSLNYFTVGCGHTATPHYVRPAYRNSIGYGSTVESNDTASSNRQSVSNLAEQLGNDSAICFINPVSGYVSVSKCPVWSMACSNKTNLKSRKITNYYEGDDLLITGMSKNRLGNLFYEIEINGVTGYVFSDNVTIN